MTHAKLALEHLRGIELYLKKIVERVDRATPWDLRKKMDPLQAEAQSALGLVPNIAAYLEWRASKEKKLMGKKIDLGALTNDEMVALLPELLELMPEADALPIVRTWVEKNGLEGEFGD